MSPSFIRIAAGAFSVPLGCVADRVQRLIMGPHAIIDVHVRGVEDSVQRQALFRRLRRLEADPNVAAVLLRLEAAPGSWAACQDLRAVIAAIRQTGRPVYAWLETPGNKEMWIASACDRVMMVPIGEVALVGVGVELTFFGAALERLGVVPDFEAAGAYKAFGEPWMRSFASPENQEALHHLVQDLQRQMMVDIAEGRAKHVDDVHGMIQRAPLAASAALDAGLVDALLYEDQLDDWLQQHHGALSKRVTFASWAHRDAVIEWLEGWGGAVDTVAVVHLQGPIVMDERGGSVVIAARKVVPTLRDLRDDDAVRAVVLHVNSPGGSVIASDMIWREVQQLRHIKPVVACFEDVAASGGYYLAAPAAEIVARPGTLTGSIGVFGGKLVAGNALRRMGVHSQEIAAAPNANLFSPSKPFTDAQRARFRVSLQHFYDGFVKRVASGRRLPEEVVEPHCRGRVWTGRAARERGLVDHYGGLDDAVERARLLSGLPRDGFGRKEVLLHRRGLLLRLVERNLRDVMPVGQLGWLARAWRDAIMPRLAPFAAVLVQHHGEVLAMLPFDIEPR